MAKKTNLEKAIEQLEGEKAVLEAAIARLKQQLPGRVPVVQNVELRKSDPHD